MAEAVAWNRSVASRPTTPNDVRCATATRYPKIPMVQISQARGAVTPSLCPARGRPRGCCDAALLPGVLPGQVSLHGGTEVVGVGKLVVFVGQKRAPHHAVCLLVIAGFEAGHHLLDLLGGLDLLGDLAADLAARFAEPVGR